MSIITPTDRLVRRALPSAWACAPAVRCARPRPLGERGCRGHGRPAAQRGFNLIEVLVTLVLLSIGLLGLAGLQARSLKNSHASFYRTIATQQAYDIADRISTNLAGVRAGSYDKLTWATPKSCLAPACTNLATMALTDECQWRCANAAVLPAGSGKVVCVIGPKSAANCTDHSKDSNRVFEVTVSWNERTQGDNVTQNFVTRFAP